MASYNRIVLMGNLTRDPQLSYTAGNVAVCKFGLATNHRRKDRDGNLKEEVCFVDCTLFGQSAETFNQYMSKGRPILVEGRLSLNQWTNQEGKKLSKHEVIVDRFVFVGGGRGEDPGESGTATTPARAATQPPANPGYDEPPVPTEDGIPF